MNSYQLSLFSGEIPDENIKKNTDKTELVDAHSNKSEQIKNTEKKQPKENILQSEEDIQIEKIYQDFKNISEPSIQQKADFLDDLKKISQTCKKCILNESRTNSVFSDGDFNSEIVLVGEGPGENEDKTGIPFVGKAGQLLDKILESADINRKKNVYVINAVKCRPPQNRPPTDEELECCSTYLKKQIEVSSGKIMLLAGATAMKSVLKNTSSITKARGQWIEKNEKFIMPIFHPSYLLRNNSKDVGSPKWLMWQDIKKIKQKSEELKGNI